MAFLRALADATSLSVLAAFAAYVVTSVSGVLPLPPAVVGVGAGVAVLAGGVGVSLSFQTEERRYPITWFVLALLSLP